MIQSEVVCILWRVITGASIQHGVGIQQEAARVYTTGREYKPGQDGDITFHQEHDHQHHRSAGQSPFQLKMFKLSHYAGRYLLLLFLTYLK